MSYDDEVARIRADIKKLPVAVQALIVEDRALTVAHPLASNFVWFSCGVVAMLLITLAWG